MEGDPPPIDCPALAFFPTNVIARQSLRSGGRFPLLCCSPVTRRPPQRETPRAWPPSVTRLRSCRAGCRCLCPVSQVSTPTSHRLPRRFAMWTPNHPPTVPAWPRAPGWPSASPRSPLLAFGAVRHRSSGTGWHALSGTSHTLKASSSKVKWYFSCAQGYPTGMPVTHRTILVVHRLRTGCAQRALTEVVCSWLNEVVKSQFVRPTTTTTIIIC